MTKKQKVAVVVAVLLSVVAVGSLSGLVATTKTYTLTVGDVQKKVKYGERIGALPELPEKEDYIARGWLLDGDLLTSDYVYRFWKNMKAEAWYEPITVTVTYKAIVDGKETEIYEGMYSAKGQYPTEVPLRSTLSVSDLLGKMTKGPELNWEGFEGTYVYSGIGVEGPSGQEYEFWGWYLDKELTVPYEGSLVVTEDVTLYADIVEVYWIGPY